MFVLFLLKKSFELKMKTALMLFLTHFAFNLLVFVILAYEPLPSPDESKLLKLWEIIIEQAKAKRKEGGCKICRILHKGEVNKSRMNPFPQGSFITSSS